jgi:tRNA(Ile)-lysidine synthase
LDTANSRSCPPADSPAAGDLGRAPVTARASPPDPQHLVHEAVRRALRSIPSGTVAVALSGGRDSVALLDALAVTRAEHGHPLVAVHVHHGLSSNADAWAAFCTDLCAGYGVPLALRHVEVPRRPGTSLENEARIARYQALAEAAAACTATHVLLGHHRDDQVETLLLQLLRGAGPHGLAGMPPMRVEATGVTWVRPLLDIPRTRIDAYVAQRRLRWVDDESNASAAHVRNALRHTVVPALLGIQAAAGQTLGRAAQLQAEAALLADDLAALDARTTSDGHTLDRAALAMLPPHRARNLLRWFLRQHALPAPSAARLAAMLTQLRSGRADAQTRLVHAGVELGVHRGRIVLHPPMPAAFDVLWSGSSTVVLPHGRLLFTTTEGVGLDTIRLARQPVRIRSRGGGESFQLAANRPRRALKSILQEEGIPLWERRGLPLVFCGDALVAVPGVGTDPAYRALPGQPGVTVTWRPGTT